MKIATTRARATQKTRAPKNKRAKPKQDFMTCDEAERLHDGRWVIMDIRKWTRWKQPEAGTVVFTADSESQLFAYGKKLIQDNPRRQYYFFYAGDPSLSGPGVMLSVTVAN